MDSRRWGWVNTSGFIFKGHFHFMGLLVPTVTPFFFFSNNKPFNVYSNKTERE